ncbi:hypothetical protein I317_04365 [Kwoniella heveanensis CBS 569]|uniref:HMG box domain-containing protein n=1 Tax=Kwoniella heveanensis BCC8398 TaxID=1296120 RepID=A0A1B9H301_9TREE|nr:hypothetical protein I316_00766 [Kwoniella heveanensis BCC8398]OCF41855.1 hypothetical protein I317_04365 [Kwoniella heveanensis CBS 569]
MSEPEFDAVAFLQSCAEFMSQPLLTPSPVLSVPPKLPDAVTTPPYTSDEGSINGDHNLYDDKSLQSSQPQQLAVNPALLIMGSNQNLDTFHSSIDPSLASPSSSMPKPPQTQSQSQSPPLSYSFGTPSIFSSYPQSYPMSSYFPQEAAVPPPPPLGSSPPWLTTDTEANASGLDLDLDVSGAGELDDAQPVEPVKSKGGKGPKIAIPRPPNAWILYRSDILKGLAEKTEIPGLEAVMLKMGYNPTTSASSDESAVEGSRGKGKGKGKATTDSEMMPPPTSKRRKQKKGAKAPTEAFLSLGRGKNGKGLPQADISKLISNLWKSETAERKAFYERKADLKKIEHQKKYPDYKFQPMRKADKIRQREQKEREKEEVKRQKEREKQAGKAKRRERTKTRLSPTSPYSVLNTTRRPNLKAVGRSLSYSGDSTSRLSWEDDGDGYAAMRRDTESSSGKDFDPLGVYPFPLPLGALPSLRPNEEPHQPTEGPSAAIAGEYQAWQQFRAEQTLYPHQIVPHNTPDVASSASMSAHSSSQSRASPASRSRKSQRSIPPPASQPPLHTLAGNGAYPRPQGLGINGAVHDAVPFIVESLPMDAQGRPIAILGLDDIKPFSMEDNDHPAQLAEMWWNLDEDLQEDRGNDSGPSGLLADERTLQMFDFDADQLGQSGTSRSSLSMQTSGSTATDPLPTPDSGSVAQDLFGMAGQGAYPHPQGYVPMFVSMIPEDGNVDPNAAFFAPGFDPNLPYLPLDAALDPMLYGQSGQSFDEQGPFLSAQQPMSPTESWSAGPTPREATFLRAAQEGQNRVFSTSSNEGTVRTVSSAHGAPRYVSSSAYPPTPHSLDPISALPSMGGIGDRNASYSAFAGLMSTQGMTASDDILGWDDGEVFEHNQGKSPIKDRFPTTVQVARVPTPMSAALSTSMPVQSEVEASGRQPASTPRSIATRSRAVASKFGGAADE